jgi:hypothetical protein
MHSPDHSDIETSLLDISKFGIAVNQWNGLIPLSVSTTIHKNGHKESKLCFRFLSFPYLWSIGLMLLVWITVYVWYFWGIMDEAKNDFEEVKGSTTGSWASFTTGTIISLIIVFQRIKGIIAPKSALGFWQDMVHRLGEISHSCSEGTFRIGTANAKYCMIFREIKRTIRVTMLFYLAFLLFHVVFPGTVFLILKDHNIIHYDFSRILVHILAINFWTCLGLVHWFLLLWVVMPLKMGTGCLQMVKEELKEIRNYVGPNKEFVILKMMEQNPSSGVSYVHVGNRDHFSKLNACIKNLYRIHEFVELYNDWFSYRLIFDIGVCAIMILRNAFIAIVQMEKGRFYDSFTCGLSIFAGLNVVYDLGSNAGQLGTECDHILDQLCQFPTHLLCDETRQMVGLILNSTYSSNSDIVNRFIHEYILVCIPYIDNTTNTETFQEDFVCGAW